MEEGGETLTLLDADWQPVRRTTDDGYYYGTTQTDCRYVIISTRGTRAVVADPTLVGQQYVDRIGAATLEALRALDWPRLAISRDARPHPLVILRGGATFSPSAALEALGFAPGPQSFITSESQRAVGATPRALQRYFKFENIDESSTLLICDIVATGATVIAAVRKALEEAPAIRQVVVLGFVTMEGARQIATSLADRVELVIVALEALFCLPGAHDAARAYTSPCDFRRSNFVCGPDYLRAVNDSPGLAEEQCVVYDGGERAFAPQSHVAGRHRYLMHLSALTDSEYRDEVEYRTGILFGDNSRLLGLPTERDLVDSVRTVVEDRLRHGVRLR